MMLSRFLQACRTLLGSRLRTSRDEGRHAAQRSDIRRKQLLMLQLNDTLRKGQRDRRRMY